MSIPLKVVSEDAVESLARWTNGESSSSDTIEKLDRAITAFLAARQNVLDHSDSAESWPSSTSASTATASGDGFLAAPTGPGPDPDENNNSSEMIDFAGAFVWSQQLNRKLRSQFKIAQFRLYQECVCNANMAGRDAFCIMATGSGKSLTFQLPALLLDGCTIVLEPLVSLIDDQIYQLRKLNISQAVSLAGNRNKDEVKEIKKKLYCMIRDNAECSIKLIYMTPERLFQDESMLPLIQSLYHAGKLARIIIDEVHAIDRFSADFRPSYQAVGQLRVLMPKVPILCYTATCPTNIRDNIVAMLRLQPIVTGPKSPLFGTVFFSGSIYRSNLHYKVLSKSQGIHQEITDYILQQHPNESGIIYCPTRKDAERVSTNIHLLSQGAIKSWNYHASLKDSVKASAFQYWRQGLVHIMCATNAFSLGIDKPDVRFVIHISLAKTLSDYLQESGRAGRDGLAADCILYYSPLDVFTTQGFLSDKEFLKMHDMVTFAEDLKTCRKILFEKYLTGLSTSEEEPSEKCNNCDNCSRNPASLCSLPNGFIVWKTLQIVKTNLSPMTVQKLMNTCYEHIMNMGGIKVSKEMLLHMILKLVFSKYLAVKKQTSTKGTHVKLILGPRAAEFTSLAEDEIDRGPKIPFIFTAASLQHRGRHNQTLSLSARSAAPSPELRIPADISDADEDQELDPGEQMEMDPGICSI